MTDSAQGWSANAAAYRTQAVTSTYWEQLRGDVSGNCAYCGDGQGLQQMEESRRDEEDGDDSQGEGARHGEEVLRVVQEEQLAHTDESMWNLRNVKFYVRLTVVYVPANARHFIAFVIRPLTMLGFLRMTREWRNSLSLLAELKVAMLTLITHFAYVEITVDIAETTDDMRQMTEIMVFVFYMLSVVVKLLFSAGQFFKCQRVAKIMFGCFVMPANLHATEESRCLPLTLQDLHGSKACSGLSWGPKPSDYSSDDLLGTCARVYRTVTEQEKGELNQVQQKYGPLVPTLLLGNAFSVFVRMCALYVAVLVAITVFKMILEATTDVLTLYTSYKIERRTRAAARSKALYHAVQQCLSDKDYTLLDRTKWCLHQLTSRNQADGAAVEPTRHIEDE
ncbi:uncharacterized protein LOC144135480 [Amblyomma americanum]